MTEANIELIGEWVASCIALWWFCRLGFTIITRNEFTEKLKVDEQLESEHEAAALAALTNKEIK
jgi:hypothetical protein